MVSVVDTAKFLERYSDVLYITALIPILGEIKFGALLRAQAKLAKTTHVREDGGSEESVKDTKGNQDTNKGTEADQSKVAKAAANPSEKALEPKTDEDVDDVKEHKQLVPPVWALVMLLLAEIIAGAQFFNSSDKKTRRAVGTMLRIQKHSKRSYQGAIDSLEKLVLDSDVYDLLRLVATLGAIGSLLVSLFLGLHERSPTTDQGPLKMFRHRLERVLRLIFRPKQWALAAICAWFVLNQRQTLTNLLQKRPVQDFGCALVPLLRALYAVGTALTCPRDGPLPFWATVTFAAGVARALCFFTVERISVEEFLQSRPVPELPAKINSARCIVALEAFSFITLLPHMMRRKRLMMFVAMLMMPCLALTSRGAVASLIARHGDVINNLTTSLALGMLSMGLVLVFIGGFQTVVSCAVLVQVLTRIHSLDTMKY